MGNIIHYRRGKMKNGRKVENLSPAGTANIVTNNSDGRTIRNLRRMDFILDVNVPGRIPYRNEHYEHFPLNI
jgi:hypothetical protein